jgi:hypothetical protein
LAASPDAPEWAARLDRGLVRITTVSRLETRYSARSGPDLRAGLRRPPLSSMPVEYLTPAIEDRAAEILALLAGRGQHRAPSISDLIMPSPWNQPGSASCTSARTSSGQLRALDKEHNQRPAWRYDRIRRSGYVVMGGRRGAAGSRLSGVARAGLPATTAGARRPAARRARLSRLPAALRRAEARGRSRDPRIP